MKHTIQICSKEEALARLADGSLYDFLVSSVKEYPFRTMMSLQKLKELRALVGGVRLDDLRDEVDLVAGDIAMVRVLNVTSRLTTLYRKVNGVWVPRDAFDVWELAAEPESRVLCSQSDINGFGRGKSLVKGLTRIYDKVDWGEGYDRYYWLGREMCWHVDGDKIEPLSIVDGVAERGISIERSAKDVEKKSWLIDRFG